MSRIYQTKAKIDYNVCVSGNYYKLVFSSAKIARAAQPGQFVTLLLSKDCQPLLRRPFSIHSIRNQSTEYREQIEILYEVRGKATEILSKKKPGDFLDILGPLGSGFDLPLFSYPQSAILVGGGIGIAPLLFLAQRLIDSYPLSLSAGRQAPIRYPLALIGARTKKEILSQKEFASLGCGVTISTDNGSAGFKGRVTGLLRKILDSGKKARGLNACRRQPAMEIYACGPKPMLKELNAISKKYNIKAQVSLDEYMACGLGVCLGCMVNTKTGYQAVCKNGPVFDSAKIIW
ncbi:MAG: dihydroorotate dehydrogenase electron transfer subunit [Candidatus Omnitrophota bacterium]